MPYVAAMTLLPMLLRHVYAIVFIRHTCDIVIDASHITLRRPSLLQPLRG